ncbi:TonB-dependent receptor [Elizabethkingia argentiflava]|uniref:TonB-dependent receptor n=1 Tax=Elizabethkingia argenteiflava TaxID=2681556 RepID=A0A845PT99_9FLAO|nr:TonB-dependent receptor [Elizabethkingia argenteiflava]NAW50273.1 TonB-dependent receptor [Elizabethkingia argenteiflava]
MKKQIQYITIIGILGWGGVSNVHAQIKEEKLILNRNREPEVKKIEKKKTSIAAEKNYPPKGKDSLRYKITNIPIVSDFKTSTIAGEDISPQFKADSHRNYFQIGYGNYGKFLFDGNVSGQLKPNLEVGADVHHIDTSGLKKDYTWNSKQQTTEAHVFLNSYGTKGKLNIDTGLELNGFNYYGNYQKVIQPKAQAELKQNFTKVGVNAYYDFYANHYLNDIRLKTSFTKDHFNSKENYYDLNLNLSKHDFQISFEKEIKLNTNMGVGIQGVNTQFDLLKKNESRHFTANFTPEFTLFKGNHYLKIGSRFTVLSSQYQSLSSDKSTESKWHWFPTAELLIAPKDEVKFYAGVNGGIKLNTYSDLLHDNPFLVSDLLLRPTETKYHLYFGVKGDIEQNFKYDIHGGYSKLNNILFYRSNNLFSFNSGDLRPTYDYLNTFSTFYDHGNLSDVSISVAYFPLENLNLSGEFKYMSYALKNFDHAFYKPIIQTTLGAKYSLLNKKLDFGFKGILVTDRKANAFYPELATPDLETYTTNEVTHKKVAGYADLNLFAEYKIHKNISLFAMGNNLLGKSYQSYLGYKVMGAQILGGVKLEF